MSGTSPKKWRPIISGAERSPWIVWRDIAITGLVWAFFFLVLEGELQFARRALSILGVRPVENLDSGGGEILPYLRPTILIILLLVAIIGAATLFSRARRNRALRLPQPTPVPDQDLARDLGLSEQDLCEMRRRKIVVLDVDE